MGFHVNALIYTRYLLASVVLTHSNREHHTSLQHCLGLQALLLLH